LSTSQILSVPEVLGRRAWAQRDDVQRHLRAVAYKAQGVMGALGKLMPNVGGPSENRRRLFVSVVHSVLLYGALTWAFLVFRDIRNVRVLASTQRRTSIRCASAYRTGSYDAVTVIARTPLSTWWHSNAARRSKPDERGTQGV